MTSTTTFGERLALALASAGLKPREAKPKLARHLGISPQAVGMVISGASQGMNAENTIRAAYFLGVDPLWLATGEGEQRSLSREARDVATLYERLPPDEKKRLWLLMQVVRAPVPDAEVEKYLPLPPAPPAPQPETVNGGNGVVKKRKETQLQQQPGVTD